MAVLPPEVIPGDFEAALQAFENVVGARWMFTSDEDVALYRDAYSPFRGEPEKEKQASAAVAPDSVELDFMVLRDRFDTHCGMEAVLPDRDLLRTGMALRRVG